MKTAQRYIDRIGILACCMALLTAPAAYAEMAGRVQFINGTVQITNASGQTQTVKKGDPVNENDTVTTTRTASAQLRMQDGGLIAIRPDTQFKVDSFKYNGKEDGSEQSFFSLLRGGIRAITGMIGHTHKQNYKIAALSTTIGIRGTDHEIWVVLPGSELAASVPPGTYNKVNKGETSMTTSKGSINILPNEMGYAAGANQMPQLQPVNLRLFTVAPSPLGTTTGNKYAAVRDSTVLDNSMQSVDNSLGNNLPVNPLLSPIKGKTGPTAPGQVF